MMIGQSEQSRAVATRLRRFASCDAPVLLEGETGTGKELAAREIHYAGVRREKPFVPVNCGALPDSLVESELFGHRRGAFTDAKTTQIGLVEHACGGTLFLDEVDTLSAKAQVTLLRFLQDREYRPVGGCGTRTADVRVISATNASLELLSSTGYFRQDLLYRLNALYLCLSPLRERKADVVPLAEHFLVLAVRRLGTASKRWTTEALRALVAYDWPGNARELENVTLRACLGAEDGDVGVEELAAVAPALGRCALGDTQLAERNDTFRAAKNSAIESFERRYLTNLMRRASGNVSAAARLSHIERRQLGKMLKKLGIEKNTFRDGGDASFAASR
jgi:DNA-binding NtrC family response regulator